MSWPTVAAAGWTSVVLLATLLLYHQITRAIPSRQRPDQAPQSKFGVVPVDGSLQELGTQLRRDGVDIVFVHGLGSNPDTTWQAGPTCDGTGPRERAGVDGDGVCWVTDLLIDDMVPSIRRKTRIFFYNHDSYWKREAVQTRLWNLAGNLLHHLQGRIRQTEEEKARDLVFVAYSYGGLLVKQALIRAKNAPLHQDIVNRTRGIIFLGTPHRGSSFSLLGSWIAWFLQPLGSNQSLLDEISYDSLNLLDLHEQFTQATRADLQIYNFFEERPTCLVDVGFFQWSKFCVKEQSATYSDSSGHVHSVGLNVDHFGLNKFGTRTAEYELIRNALVHLLPPPLRQISVPLAPVETYAPRQDLSRQIREALRVTFHGEVAEVDESEAGFQAVVIHGMGGVGKTQLALNYAQETRGCYNPVFWIDAHTKETVQASFDRGAAALGLTFQNPSTADIELQASPTVAGVCRWFSERDEGDPRWLVIVDNADNTSWRIDDIIPRGIRGHVIVTSQHRQTPNFLGRSCKFVEAREMSRDEARTLLKNHICLAVDFESAQQLDEMEDLCDQVADRLGYLALAVELAGLYLSDQLSHHFNDTNTVKSDAFYRVLRQYLDDFERHQDELLQQKPFQRLSTYEKTVWTVWDTSLAAIENQFPQSHASQMLTFLAQFDRGHVEEEIFRLASDGWLVMADFIGLSDSHLPDWLHRTITRCEQDWDDFYYRKATQPLTRYGLLRPLDGKWLGTTMHSLVQWRARKAGAEMMVEWRRWALLFLLAAVCQANCEERYGGFRRGLIAHLLEMNIGYGKLAQEFRLHEIEFGWLGEELAHAFYVDGRYREAEEVSVQAVEVRKNALGPSHLHTLESMQTLAVILGCLRRYEEAEDVYREISKLREGTEGGRQIDTLWHMSNFGTTLAALGKYEEAEKIQREALKKAEESLGKESLGKEYPLTLSIMTCVGGTLKRAGKYEEAEKILRDAIKLRQSAPGEEHPETLVSMNNLAMVLHSRGQFEEAKSILQEVLQACERVLGKEHPDTLMVMSNLATVFYEQQDFEEAMRIRQEVVPLRKKVLGKEHIQTLGSMNHLAADLWQLRDFEGSKRVRQEVIQLRKKVQGKEHPDTLKSMNNLAAVLWQLRDFEGAKRIWQEVKPLMEKVVGKGHPDMWPITRNLEIALEKQAALDGP